MSSKREDKIQVIETQPKVLVPTVVFSNDQWGVGVGVTRVELFGGAGWVEFNDELTAGEQRQIDNAAIKNLQAPTGDMAEERAVGLDMRKHAIERLYVWLSDWSRIDAKGNKIPISRVTVAGLKAEVFDAIEQALDKHIRKMRPESDGSDDAKNANGSSRGTSAPRA